MTEGYLEDLAWVHHTSFGELAREAAATLLAELRPGGLVIDLGCGSGVLAREVTAAGFSVLGVDPSEAMLRIAADEAPTARFVRSSLDAVDLPPCVAVTAVGEAFCYAGADLPAMFARIFAALEPGGILLFDVAGPGRLSAPIAVHEDPDGDWLLTMRAAEAGDRLTRRITLFRRVGDRYRRSDETHVLRLYDLDRVPAQLVATGFSAVRRMGGWGRVAFTPGWAGFVAQRPATGSPPANDNRAMRSDRVPPLP